MKFTKEQAFEKLKGILTNEGKKPLRMSEKSINAQLDTLMPLIAGDETELDDFIAKVKPTFETMNGNAEHDYSAFVDDWKKQHPDTPTPPTPPTPPAPQPNPDEDKLKALQDEIDALKKRNADQDKALRDRQTLDAVRAALKKDNRSFDGLLDIVLRGAEVGEGDTVDTLTQKYKTAYDEQYKILYGDGAVPPASAGTPPAQTYKKGQFAGVVAKLQGEGLIPKDESQK